MSIKPKFSSALAFVTSLASSYHDHLIFAAVGAGAMGAGLLFYQCLELWRDAAKIIPVQPKAKYITQDTEDALTVNTLDSLLGHYNYAIRETAAKIVCDRVVNDEGAIELLLYGITSPDYDERMRNLRALAVITDPGSLELLHTRKAYTALVRSLELCLEPNQEELDPDRHWDEYPLRDMAEKLPMMFICQLAGRFKPELLVKAKFVEKWLAKQNWGADRSRTFMEYREHKQNRISEIIHILMSTQSGQTALVKAGLLPQSAVAHFGDEMGGDGENEENEENDGPSTAERAFNLVNSRNGVDEEDDARVLHENRLRRNREAMVFSDGSHPLTHDDIIQRNP